jgi:anti-sigma factor RsiW
MLDGELDAAGAVEAEHRLAADPQAQVEYARLQVLRTVIRTHTPRESAPEALRARLVAAASADEASPLRPTPTPARHMIDRPSWRMFASAIAATVVVSVGAQTLIRSALSPDDATRAVVAGYVRGQISEKPVDVASSDRHTVKPWLANKLPVAALIVDLSAEGFPLLGGRVDVVGGNPVPTLVYKHRQHLLTVTELRPSAVDYAMTPRHITLDGYSVVFWKDSAHGYVAVSDIAPAEFDAFIEIFRKAAAKEQDRQD